MYEKTRLFGKNQRRFTGIIRYISSLQRLNNLL